MYIPFSGKKGALQTFKMREVKWCYNLLEFWMFNSLLKPFRLEDAYMHVFVNYLHKLYYCLAIYIFGTLI